MTYAHLIIIVIIFYEKNRKPNFRTVPRTCTPGTHFCETKGPSLHEHRYDNIRSRTLKSFHIHIDLSNVLFL
jgi:hypothetical protein